MKHHIPTGIAAILICTLSASAALAKDGTGKNGDGARHVSMGFPVSSKEIKASIGLAVRTLPDYEGSDDAEASISPHVDFRYGGSFLRSGDINPNDGFLRAGLAVFEFSSTPATGNEMRISLGPLVRYRRGREEDDNDVLNGLGEIDKSIEIGGFLETRIGPWMADISVAKDVNNGHKGVIAAFGAKYTARASDRLTIVTGLSTSWVNDDYMQSYFGVTDAQAAQSRLARFDAGGGFKDVGVQVEASYRLSAGWSLEGQAGYWRLLSDAADSPLVDENGSANQFRALLGFAYLF